MNLCYCNIVKRYIFIWWEVVYVNIYNKKVKNYQIDTIYWTIFIMGYHHNTWISK